MTPPVLVRVPRAVISPPVIVPAACPLPAIIRMPVTPALLAPARLTLPAASTIKPPSVPELLINAAVVIPPPTPRPVKYTPDAPVIVAEATVLIARLVAPAELPLMVMTPAVVLLALIIPAAVLAYIP